MQRVAVSIVLLPFLPAPLASAQDVWVVRAAPAEADFAEIQDAVDAAGDGDVILVGAGSYRAVTVDGKSLAIQAEPGAEVELSSPFDYGSLAIRNLAAGQSVSVRGIDAPLGSSGVLFQAGLVVDNCAGPVLIEDGVYSATPIGHPAGFARGASISRSSSVTLVRCDIEGLVLPFGPTGPAHGEPGLHAIDSDIQLYESTVAGTSAAEMHSGSLFVSGSLLAGDVDGMLVDDSFVGPGALARVLDTGLTFGPGGQAVNVVSGELIELDGTADSFEHSSPVREGEATLETYVGSPGDFVLRALSPVLATSAFLLPLGGANHLGAPLFLRARGLVPATGTLTRSITIIDLGPGIDVANVFEQAVFVDPVTLELTVTDPASILLLDASL